MSAGADDAAQCSIYGGSAVADIAPGSLAPEARHPGVVVTSHDADAGKDVNAEAVQLAQVVTAAAAAGRTRITTAANAALWTPPDLKALRYRPAERDAIDGEPTMWYWQMTGRLWDRKAKPSYDAAKKAHGRLLEGADHADERRTADREKHADARALARECEQQEAAEREEQERAQARAMVDRRETKTARVAIAAQRKARASERELRLRDPNPRRELLGAFADVRRFLRPVLDVGAMLDALAAGGEARPDWANWWPCANWWSLAEHRAFEGGWDGSWCGRHATYQLPERPGPHDLIEADDSDADYEHSTRHPHFQWRQSELRLLYMERHLPPSSLPSPEAVPSLAPELEESEQLTGEQQHQLWAHERALVSNAVLAEYAEWYTTYLRCRGAIACPLPALAPDAHGWAPSILLQARRGERALPEITDDRWPCDFGVRARLSKDVIVEPRPPLPLEIEHIVEQCRRRSMPTYSGPHVRELKKYFQGDLQEARQVKSFDKPGTMRTIPTTYVFSYRNSDWWHRLDADQPRVRTVSRVRLQLSAARILRGSHCRRDLGELGKAYESKWHCKWVQLRNATSKCDCRGPADQPRPAPAGQPQPASAALAVAPSITAEAAAAIALVEEHFAAEQAVREEAHAAAERQRAQRIAEFRAKQEAQQRREQRKRERETGVTAPEQVQTTEGRGQDASGRGKGAGEGGKGVGEGGRGTGDGSGGRRAEHERVSLEAMDDSDVDEDGRLHESTEQERKRKQMREREAERFEAREDPSERPLYRGKPWYRQRY